MANEETFPSFCALSVAELTAERAREMERAICSLAIPNQEIFANAESRNEM